MSATAMLEYADRSLIRARGDLESARDCLKIGDTRSSGLRRFSSLLFASAAALELQGAALFVAARPSPLGSAT